MRTTPFRILTLSALLVLTSCATRPVVGTALAPEIVPSRSWSAGEFAQKIRSGGAEFEVLTIPEAAISEMIRLKEDGDRVWEIDGTKGRTSTYYCLVRGRRVVWVFSFPYIDLSKARS